MERFVLFLLVVLLVTCSTIKEVTAQSPCMTPERVQGTCVNIQDCPQIALILQNAPKPLPAGVQSYILNLRCGTVNGKHGLCCRSPSAPSVTSTSTTTPASGDPSNHRNINLLPTDDCGPISTNKIAGGEKAGLGEFPWMTLLRYNTPDGLRYLCGASIINRRYILTAAHCVSRLRGDTSLYSVVVGDQNTGTDPDCSEGTCNRERKELFVEETIPHSSYNNPRYANDIALLRLSSDIDFSGEYVKPVCLPVTSVLQSKVVPFLIISGWGTTENNTASQDLLKGRVNVVPINDCRVAHRQNQLTDDQLCAKGKGIIDTCRGDSGGPLVHPGQVIDRTARYIQYGIVSAGARGCGSLAESLPGIYVRVQSYMNWILDNMRA